MVRRLDNLVAEQGKKKRSPELKRYYVKLAGFGSNGIIAYDHGAFFLRSLIARHSSIARSLAFFGSDRNINPRNSTHRTLFGGSILIHTARRGATAAPIISSHTTYTYTCQPPVHVLFFSCGASGPVMLHVHLST